MVHQMDIVVVQCQVRFNAGVFKMSMCWRELLTLAAVHLVLVFWRIDYCILLLMQKVN